MNKVKLVITLLVVLIISCAKKNNNNNTAPIIPAYVGTYVGKDSIETYNNGTLVATNLYSKTFTVDTSNIIGKNAYLLNFQSFDTVQANFNNGTIAIFGTTSPSMNNFVSNYDSNKISYYLEYNNITTLKVYGKYTKQ